MSNKLKVNQIAPNFTATDVLGNRIQLKNYSNQAVFLSFLRNVDCIFCNWQIRKLIQFESQFRAQNVKVILFMQSKDEYVRELVESYTDFPFTVIADYDKSIYREYGIESSWMDYFKVLGLMHRLLAPMKAGIKVKLFQRGEQHLMPAEFLLDEGLKIVKVKYGKHVADHFELESLLEK